MLKNSIPEVLTQERVHHLQTIINYHYSIYGD